MPVVDLKPGESPVPVNTQTPEITNKSFKGVAVDDRVTPLKSLTAYLEGSPWNVQWFGQLLGDDNELKPLDVVGTAINQQYFCIEDLELRVDSPLTSSMSSDSGIQAVTGSAVLLPILTPNKHDYFMAESGMGRRGLFHITEIERLTFNRDSAFRIEYELVVYIDTDVTMYNSMLSKVQRTYVYHKNRLAAGQQPLLTKDDTDTVNRHLDLVYDLQSYYVGRFYRPELNTIVLPGQPELTYDPYVVKFLLSVFELENGNTLRNINQYSYENDLVANQCNIWSILLNRKPELLADCMDQYRAVDTIQFSGNPRYRTMAYTNMQRVMYPIHTDPTVLSDVIPIITSGYELEPVAARRSSVFDALANNIQIANLSYPPIRLITELDAYVFPLAWYQEFQTSSVLEILVRDYLKHRALNGKHLNTLADMAYSWGRLEQFYYIPILVVLLKSAIRETTS